MESPDITRVRTRLAHELRRVTRNVRSATRAGRDLIEDVCRPGGPPPLSSLTEQRMLSGLRDRDTERVRALMDALRRLDRGDYGVCARCAEPIGDERLDLIPEAETCSACTSGDPT